MCSVGDDEDLENQKYMPPKTKISDSDKCNKCREQKPCLVLRSKDKYCKACFLAATVHKFKALLGKHKLIRPNDRVLILHKGGHASTALLHFIRTGLDLENHKKLRFEPVVLFIDSYFYLTIKERNSLLREIEREATKFGFEIYFASLAKLFVKNEVDESVVKERPSDLHIEDEKDDFLAKQCNKSLRSDYFNIKNHEFLIKIAKYLKCKFVFTPELSADIASQLLTDISMGRGSHVPLDTGFCDSRDPDVKILRPLRLFDAKELVFYNHFNGLEPTTFREEQVNCYDSVQNLMKKFVNDLQINYPATVTTILKTGDKLGISRESQNNCTICKGPLEERQNNCLSSAESTEFSHWLSTQIPDYAMSPQERYNKLLETFPNSSNCNLCFACKKLK